MKKIPIQCACVNGVPFAPVAVGISASAGLRSLFRDDRDTSLALLLWALGGRLAVSATGFAVGFVLAHHLAARVVAAFQGAGGCSVLVPALVVFLAMGSLPPDLPPFETVPESDVDAYRLDEVVFRPSGSGHAFLSSTHHRVLVWTTNGRVRRVHLPAPLSCDPSEPPCSFSRTRTAGLFDSRVPTDLRPPARLLRRPEPAALQLRQS